MSSVKVTFRCEHGKDHVNEQTECDRLCACGHRCDEHPMDICIKCPCGVSEGGFVEDNGGVRC
jgi:hypothetical protein